MDEMRKTVGNAAILSAVIAVVMTAVSMLGMHRLLVFMHTPEDIFDGAYGYIMIICAGIFTQVLYNLVNNAVKYTPAGSRITVRVERHAPAAEPGHAPAAGERDVVTTSVTDDGPGIAPADRDRVFDTFYTVGRGLADGRRSFGLGLALCKSISEAHGGAIRLEPNRADGHGCVFSFDLPACDLGSDLEGGGVPDEQ